MTVHQASTGRLRSFWDMKSAKYPLPDEPETFALTMQSIELIKRKGVPVKGSRILDIGCGTGVFTIPLAAEAAHVVGLDVSEGMLNRLHETQKRLGIVNIETVAAAWCDMDVARMGWDGAFDVVWAAMTPAIRTAHDIEIMERCSSKWCVYIGWGSVRRNPFVEYVFQAHGLNLEPPPGASNIQGILQGKGKSATIEFVQESWSWCGSVDEACDDMRGHLRLQGAEIDEERLRMLISDYAHDGVICHRTEAEKGIIVWTVS